MRVDARSLGLFRVVFGVVLLCDWARRYRWIKEFYSNDGVLPNHNHIFLLFEHTRVWSLLHAFTTPGENKFAFCVIFVVYAFFLVGWRTRAFQLAALVGLVSLTGRNILTENAGSYIGIALLAFTFFLPLGSRFSVDALLTSLDERDEKNAKELNEPLEDDDRVIAAKRLPGWSPVSAAAFAVLAEIVAVYVVQAVQRSGSWLDGTALRYALANPLSVSSLGASTRAWPPGVLVAWTYGIRLAEVLIPALVVFPALPKLGRFTRLAAVVLAVFYGFSFGLLFDMGLYGWSMAAAAALFIPPEAWNRWLSPGRGRAVTMIYDADCGVCLWLCRLLKRLDLRGHITFQGNDALSTLTVRGAGGLETIDMPAEITDELVLGTVVAVRLDKDGKPRVATRGQAARAAIGALPFGFLVAGPMGLPGISGLADALYDAIATRRQDISVMMGKEACGIPQHVDRPQGYRDAKHASAPVVAPAVRAARTLTGGAREIGALAVLAAAIAQTTHANGLPTVIPQTKALAAIAQWPRMLARWNVLTPEPSRDAEVFVVDAQTRGGQSVDVLTGKDPDFKPLTHERLGLGQLWGDYLVRVHEKDWAEFQRALRDYLGKGGPRWQAPLGDAGIAGFDAYWVRQPLDAPDGPTEGAAEEREKLFSFSRGGRARTDFGLAKPQSISKPKPRP